MIESGDNFRPGEAQKSNIDRLMKIRFLVISLLIRHLLPSLIIAFL